MIILKIVGLLDMLAGIFLTFSIIGPLGKIFIYLYIVKGIWSILSSVAVGYYFDWMGATDLLTGIGLLLLYFGLSSPLFTLVGIIMILKGLYIVFSGFLAS